MSSEDATAEFALAANQRRVDLTLCCLLLAGAYDDRLMRPGGIEDELDALAALAARVPSRGDPVKRLAAVLGGHRTLAGDYADLRASMLHDVRRSGHGLPIMLSVLWLDAAARVGIPAFPVGLRGHFVVGIGDPEGAYRLVDPARGGRAWRLREGDAEDVRPWGPVDVLRRVVANVMAWAAGRADRTRHRLTAVDLAIGLPHRPLSLYLERGRLLVSTGDFVEGAEALMDYARLVDPVDEEASHEAQREARQARSLLN